MLTAILVNSLDDVVASDGVVTLREAIEAANTNTAVYDAPAGSATEADIISFDPTLFTDGTDSVPGTITLSGTELEITDTAAGTEIQGPGAELLTIDADGLSQVFVIGYNSETNLSGITITGGFGSYGGGVYNSGDLVISDSVITGNTADSGGGVNSSSNTLTIINSTISDNTAKNPGGGGGGIYGPVNLVNSTVSGNTAEYGGGIDSIYNGSTITNSTIANNSAHYGGGIYTHTDLTLQNSILAANESFYSTESDISFDAISFKDRDKTFSSESSNNLIGVWSESTEPCSDSLWGTSESPLDADLTAVSDEAGQALYYLPNPGSSVIDAGSDSLATDPDGNPLTTDMLGNTRILGSQVDIGAVEYTGELELVVTSTPEVEITEGESAVVYISLSAEPTSSVVVTIQKQDGGSADITSNTATLEFNSSNWNVAQPVTISVAEDADRGNDDFATFAFSAEGVETIRVSVSVVDNDAQTYVVNSLADTVYLNGVVTLREAIQAANTNATVGDAPGGCEGVADIITFDVSLAGHTITLGGSELEITEDLVIEGLGSGVLTIDANERSRVFQVTEGVAATIQDLTITGGNYSGINNRGNLTVVDCVISGNSTNYYGGGIYHYCGGTLDIIDSVITDNTAERDGGGVYGYSGTATITNSTISNNTANYGGGIYSRNTSDSLTITDSTIQNNSATCSGGGGIYSESIATTITDSTICWNVSEGGGGGVFSRVWSGYASLNVSGSVIENNTSNSYSGGGIYADISLVTIDNSIVCSNSAYGSGGGILQSGEALISNSIITDNWSQNHGGGISGSGVLTIVNTSITENESCYYGGGIRYYGKDESVLTLINSTIASNAAIENGGGIYSEGYYADGGKLLVINSTVINNVTSSNGGGIYNAGNELTLTNSIFASNIAASYPDLYANTSDFDSATDYNLVSIWDGGDFLGDHSILGTTEAPLELDFTAISNEDGTVLYYRPWQTNPAVDAGSDVLAVDQDGNPLTTDAAGNARIVGTAVDMGAVELSETPELAITKTPSIEMTEGESVEVEVMLTAAPTSTVSVTIEKSLDGSDDINSDVTTLEFDATNWNVPQTVTISAAIDLDSGRDIAVFAFESSEMEPVYLAVAASDVDGQSYIVDSLEDLVAVDGVITLREAIEAANTNADVGDAPAGNDHLFDAITFAPELSSGTIVLSGTQLEILDDLRIIGLGDDLLTIDADELSRVFEIGEDVEVVITDLTITGGSLVDEGGGIYNAGILSVVDSTLTDNMVYDYGGGIYNVGTMTLTAITVSDNVASGYCSGRGAGICNMREADIVNSTITGNVSTQFGGGIYNDTSTLTITTSNISNNASEELGGGGIYGHGEIVITDSSITNNTADFAAGIYASTLTLSNSIVSGNISTESGGGIDASGPTEIINSIITSNSSGTCGGGIYFSHNSDLSIVNSVIADNSAAQLGGGLYYYGSGNAGEITNCTIVNNTSESGGGIYLRYGSLVLTNSIISLNQTADSSADIALQNTTLASESDYNLIGIWDETVMPGTNSICGTSESPLDPELVAITDENGFILYYRPYLNSPAVNAGSNALAVDADGNALATDMLGNTRIYDGTVDIGAVELSAMPELAVTMTPSIEMMEGEDVAVEVMLTAAPSGTITVTVTKNVGDSDSIAADLAALTFDATNWNVPQTVTLAALHDLDAINETATFSFSADDMDTVRIAVSATDDDGQTYVVDSLADVVAADGVLTLREALEAANTNTGVGDALAGSANYTDVITFAPELAGGTIVLSGSQLEILDEVDIQGLGTDLLTIDANQKSRVLYVAEDIEAAISGLTITGGFVNDLEDENWGDDGGGILNQGKLTITQSDIVDNATDGGYSYGGGICNVGTLDIVESTIARNVVISYYSGYGGGISNGSTHGTAGCGTLTIVDSLISDNTSGSAGGIYALGTVTIEDSYITDNFAEYEGAGVYIAGTVLISDSTIAGNDGIGIYVGIYRSSVLEIVRSTISENADTGIENDTATVIISDSTIANNAGRGIINTRTMVIQDSIISGNLDGGIIARSNTTIERSVIVDNVAASGAGVYATELTVIIDSVIASNVAEEDGGGIYHADGLLTLANCNVADNSAGLNGGGIIYSDDANSLTVTNSTIVANHAGQSGGGLYATLSPTLANSIVASNESGVSAPDVLLDEVSLSLESDYNLIGVWDDATAPGANSLWGTTTTPLDPMLVTVNHPNGYQYYQPTYSSPAVDAGSDALAVDPDGNPLGTDMLGQSRVEGISVDIGAIELPSTPRLIVDSAPTVEMVEGDYAQINVSLTSPLEETVFVTVTQTPEDGVGISFVLVFNATNWDTPQTVTLLATEDANRDNESTLVSFSADGMNTVDVSLSIIDNDPQAYVVDSLEDVIAIDGVITLREALEAANTNTPVGDAPEGCEGLADVISFSPDLFTDGEVPVSGTITLNSTQLEILDDVEIQGPGTDMLTIDAVGQSRVFYVGSYVAAAISGLTVTGGVATDIYPDCNGGGIYVDAHGTLALDSSSVSANEANNHGGGIYTGHAAVLTITASTISSNHSQSTGGGIDRGTMATLVIADSVIEDNQASVDGGGIYTGGGGVLTIDGSTIAGNTGFDDGGGIFHRGDATITNSTIADNSAGWAGGIWVGGNNGTYAGGPTLTISNSIIEGNSSNEEGGGMLNYYGYTMATNCVFRENSSGSRGGAIYNQGYMTLNDIDIYQNTSSSHGGGLYNASTLYLTAGSTVSENTSIYGGGIFNKCSGFLYVTDGSIIENNSATYGGGIYGYQTTQMTITDSSILDNSASRGAGIYVDDDARLTIDNSTIAENTASTKGGGIYIDPDAYVSITESILSLNSGQYGGGIYSNTAIGLTVSGLTISNNSASIHGGGIYLDDATITLDNMLLDGNSAGEYGGGVYSANDSDVTVTNSTFSGNSADSVGGGVFNMDGTLTIADSTFADNWAQHSGGAICSSDNLSITNSNIANNTTNYSGGAIFSHGAVDITDSSISDNTTCHYGGGIYSHDGTLNIANTIISGNSVDKLGGGMYLESSVLSMTNSVLVANMSEFCGGGIYTFNSFGLCDISITNSTVTANSALTAGGGIHATAGTLVLVNTILSLNDASTGENLQGVMATESDAVIFGTDPGFVCCPSSGTDGIWGTEDDDLGDLRLRQDSPAVNAGNNELAVDNEHHPLETDLDGNPRIIFNTVDIGAYEFHLVADANFDGIVDNEDKTILFSHYGMTGVTCGEGDFNNDGVVNIIDVAILAGNWGATWTPSSEAAAEETPEPICSIATPSIGPMPARATTVSRQLVQTTQRNISISPATISMSAATATTSTSVATSLSDSVTAAHDIALSQEDEASQIDQAQHANHAEVNYQQLYTLARRQGNQQQNKDKLQTALAVDLLLAADKPY